MTNERAMEVIESWDAIQAATVLEAYSNGMLLRPIDVEVDVLIECEERDERIYALSSIARSMWKLIHGVCESYPRLIDPNSMAGGQAHRPMPDDTYRELLERTGVHVD